MIELTLIEGMVPKGGSVFVNPKYIASMSWDEADKFTYVQTVGVDQIRSICVKETPDEIITMAQFLVHRKDNG